ncbi:hypothetical protein BET10_08215 [Pseudoalteromonas amylolytica]|uniref:Uncharacterized protein n=1 Tax=Pseudoalteromonas amylolytica TaxID=1859457 RepID=A0A1S1MVZ6_9GAMM|nr:hypothetical protein BFC16_19520 [Pseudoalteromonas sp. JW3]OHU91774.1 hypothetical protein BET10_08215 [Pseudoalteromonas amylolytica]
MFFSNSERRVTLTPCFYYLLQRTTRYHENQTASLQAEIEHLRDIVGARDKLKEMRKDLIAISDRFTFKDTMLKFERDSSSAFVDYP